MTKAGLFCLQAISVLFMAFAIDLSVGAPGLFFTHLPSQPADTKVFRDYLGNQQTSYAYQDGHSSAVAVSRSDSNTYLVHPQPVVYETQVAAVAPAVPVAPAVAAVAAPAPVVPAVATDYHHYHHYQPALVAEPAAPVIYDDYQHLHHHHHDYYV